METINQQYSLQKYYRNIILIPWAIKYYKVQQSHKPHSGLVVILVTLQPLQTWSCQLDSSCAVWAALTVTAPVSSGCSGFLHTPKTRMWWTGQHMLGEYVCVCVCVFIHHWVTATIPQLSARTHWGCNLLSCSDPEHKWNLYLSNF